MFTILSLTLGPIETNCYVIGDEATKEAIVIDPGDESEILLEALRARDWQVRYVLLTHAHFDHIGAVADVVEATEAPVAVHPLELPLLRAKGGALMFEMDIRPCPEPDMLLEPGKPLDIGNFHFEVLFVPGHSEGHVAFYLPAAKAVFSGDVLFLDGIGRTDLPGGHYGNLMNSIRDVLLKLPGETVVYPGHGPATTLWHEKQSNPFLADYVHLQ